jgi:hypothetical protein
MQLLRGHKEAGCLPYYIVLHICNHQWHTIITVLGGVEIRE